MVMITGTQIDGISNISQDIPESKLADAIVFMNKREQTNMICKERHLFQISVCVCVCSSLARVAGYDAKSFANICFAFLAP